MDQLRFVHLHLHTEYSLLDGAIRIDRLLERVKALGMDAVAVTDHGNLHGAMEFTRKATAAGIKPILGIEAYVAPGDRREKSSTGFADGGFHLVLLAETNTGWGNLLKLSSDAFVNGFYYRPRMDKTTLAAWSDGLIAINGHLGSSIAHHLTQYAATNNDAHYRAAIDEARWHADTFGTNEQGEPRFFLEIQRHGSPEQDRLNPLVLRLAGELDLPVVADNDTHFLLAEDHDIHDSLCCISMGRTKDDPSRLHYSPQLYLKSQQEMAELFADAPEALANTARIADRCHVELDASASHAPIVKIHKDTTAADIEAAPDSPPIGSTAWFQAYCARYQLRPFDSVNDDTSPDELARQCDEALGNLCRAGLTWRYGTDGVTEEIRQRLDRELKILADKRISAYFLIVWDFVNEARRRGIPAGARGSGVGTMVGYVLGLSNACPQRYGLLFERFTDPDRSEYPDIDIDMCQDGRGELIDYVRQKYGHVAQIITFGRLKARAAIKDVARVLGLTPGEGQRLSNFVPSELHITIDAALQKEPDFRAEYESNPTSRRVVDTARAIEGHARHAGVHAAGVVIATQPLEHIVPLYRAQGSDDLVTQWDGPTCERAGLLKMDFLGLRTLSTLELAKRLIRETLPESAVWKAVGREPGDGGPDPLDLDRLRYDDPRVFDLFRRGDTAGVFQFESHGMRRLLVDLKPDRIEDLIAANALFRPGPMDLIPEYTQRKHGRQPVPKIHEIVDRYTEETYGIMVYQEQVMQILHSLGDIPLRRAYTLIKAISKKKRAVIDSERSNFIEAAREKGLPGKKADDLYTLVLKFAGYGFNKCVVADTEVIDAHTGQRISVGDLFDQFQSGATQAVFVHALGDDGQLRPRRVTDVVWNGVCPVFELRTRTGRRIVATANHPFHTFDGWTDLAELHVGDRIAAPRRLEVQTDQSWPRHELIALAGLISEGNTCHPSCLYFYNNDQCLVEDFAQASHEFPESKSRIYQRSDKRLEVCVSIGRASRFVAGQQPWSASDRGGIAVAQPKAPSRSGMFRWAQSLGLLGCRASKKRLPAAVFQLQDADLELLLGRMWAGDGFICNKTQFTPFYATSSEQLAKDVQTLLLRLGIVSNIHRKMFRYRGGKRVGYTVHLLGDGSIDTFATRIGPHCLSREDSVQLLQRYASKVALSVGHTRSSRDTIPGNVRRWVDQERRAAGLTWRELERQSGVSMKEFPGSGSSRKRGFWRLTIAKLAKFFGSKRLEQLAHSDVYWDEVLSIEPIGTEDVYDLTVEEDHNFVADGLVVHNSHSTGYAIIAYETAYLKTYFPNHYMAAVLTYESAARKVDDWVPYLEDCKATVFPDHTDNRPHLGVEVKPPDVNLSEANFSVVFMADEVPDACRGHVRFGLDAIKGVSTSAINAIIDERRTHGPFTSIFDFCERVDLRSVNKATIEALVKSGAFDSMHSIEERSAAHAAVTDAISAGQAAADDRRSGQMNFFSTGESPVQAAVSRALPSVPPWERMKTLTFEKDTLGFFVSGHPLDVHETQLRRFRTHEARSAMALADKTPVKLGGLLTNVRQRVVGKGPRSGQKWATATLGDKTGTLGAVIFSEAFGRHRDLVANDAIVALTGRVDRSRGEPSVIVESVLAVDELDRHLASRIELDLVGGPDDDALEPIMQTLEQTLRGAAGNGGRTVEVLLHVHDGDRCVALKPNRLRVTPKALLLDELERVLGPGHVRLVGRESPPA